MSLPRYPEYKDSGVEWLGEIPSHWIPSRFKWLIERNDGGVWGDDPDGADDTLVLRSTEQAVDGRWKIEDPAFRKLAPRDRNFALLRAGDLLVTKSSGSSLHIGKTTLVDEYVAGLGACYSNFMQRIRASNRLHPKLAWYLLNTEMSRLQFALLSNSTTGLANLNGTIIGELLIAVQPREEQERIVAFLDYETAKIDALIAEQERLLALLDQKRQATISHLVTRGLNPQAPMKDSGIPWVGEVPAHWKILPLKRDLAFLTSGSRGWAEHYSDEGAIFLRIGNLTRDSVELDLSDIQRVAPPDHSEGERTRVASGDVLFSITAYLGSVAVVPADLEPAYVSQHVALARLCGRHFLPKWVGYTTLSLLGKTYLAHQGYGGTKVQLSLDDIACLPVVAPPLSEQQKILDVLELEIHKLGEVRAESEVAIRVLRERRSALIAAAVTGQIDVRSAVEPAAA